MTASEKRHSITNTCMCCILCTQKASATCSLIFMIETGFWKNLSTIQAFLSGVPDEKMIILDLNSEQSPLWQKTKLYFGKPFIWCMLHNYGGTRGVYGPMNVIAVDPVKTLQVAGKKMAGIGLTPEAIEHNPVVYDLMVSQFTYNSHLLLKAMVVPLYHLKLCVYTKNIQL